MAHGKPLLRRLAINRSLDLEEDVDTPQGLAGNRGFSRFRQVEELSAAMAPAGRFKDRRRLPVAPVEVIVSVEGVGLHETDVAGKMALRVLSSPVARVV